MIKNVLIPLDGSKLAECALEYAPKIVPPEGAITLLSVVRVPSTYFATEVPLPMVYTASEITRLLRDEMDGARDYLNDVALKLRIKGYKIFNVVETGDPALVITDQSRYYDAVLMTTHGRTGLGRLMYGSVTQQVIGMATRPVIVIPNTEEEALPEVVTETEYKKEVAPS